MLKRVRIEFFGDVHGTGYRFFIKQKALELGLKGYCIKNKQGNIEVEVEGSAKAVDEFIVFVYKGVSLQAGSTGFNIKVLDSFIGYKHMESDIV